MLAIKVAYFTIRVKLRVHFRKALTSDYEYDDESTRKFDFQGQN